MPINNCESGVVSITGYSLKLKNKFKISDKQNGTLRGQDLEHLFESIIKLDEKLQELGIIDVNGKVFYLGDEETSDV